MRAGWLILLGITVLGCKDKPASQSTEQHSAPAPASGVAAVKPAPNLGSSAPTAEPADAAAPATPAEPPGTDEISREFAAEEVDADWATNAARGIAATAPELKDVECRSRHCRATLTGASEKALVDHAEKLLSDSALRGLDARSVIYAGVQTGADGAMSLKLFIRYDR